MKVFRAVGILFVAAVVMWQSAMPAAGISTVETEILPQSPLIISSYQTRSGGTDIAFVGLFNSSDLLLDMSEWRVVDVSNSRSLTIESSYQGYIAPKQHVVLSVSNMVDGATYTITGWNKSSLTPAVPAKLTSLRVERSDSEHLYRPVDISSIKTNDLPQVRIFGASSYNATFEEKKDLQVIPEDGLYLAPPLPSLRVVEVYPYSSDCAPNDHSTLCGDYVKLQNTGSVPQLLDDLVLRTSSSSSSSTSSNTFTLAGILEPGGYYTVWQTDDGGRISLTNSGGYVWLEDRWGIEQYAETMTRYESAGSGEQGYAYALNELESWRWTSTPQPSSSNVITAPIVALAPCPEGQYRNPDTNRCRKIEEVLSDLAACEEGYERNPLTNRCRKTTSSSSATLTPCKEGQVRNPETNRCRSIASEVADLIPCNDGYERNPATNRCRKVQAGSEVKGAEYPVEPVTQGSGNMAGLWTLAGVGAVALLYAAWEWRHEIARLPVRIMWWRK